MTNWTLLDDRSVLRVAGEDAVTFLHGLVTNDVEHLATGEARFAALLTPQGKILFDFFVYRSLDEAGATFFIDCPTSLAADLLKRLGFYRLRAKVTIADLSAERAVAANWSGSPAAIEGFVFADPRDARLGLRAILPRAAAASFEAKGMAEYEARRIAVGAPRGGVDFPYGDAFPHDVNMDILHGIDFEKGCYVGQEVVSRMRHRGGVRKRVLKAKLAGPASPGAPILAGEATIGSLGSSMNGEALALVRTDRLTEVRAEGKALTAGGVAIAVDEPISNG